MADVTFFVIKRGASGAAFVATLKDDSGPVDLSDFTEVLFVAKRAGRGTVISGAECDINPDQVNLKGKVRYEFDDSTSDIPSGEYDVEFHATDSDGLHVFPTSKAEPYGKLIVLPAL